MTDERRGLKNSTRVVRWLSCSAAKAQGTEVVSVLTVNIYEIMLKTSLMISSYTMGEMKGDIERYFHREVSTVDGDF